MGIISICTADVIKDAAARLINGDLVAFPTETVYGLGADATNKDAIARIYKVKGRPLGHPLIVHISSIVNIDKWAQDIPEYALNLARAFWPGPMTLILPRTHNAMDFITGGQDNVGIRVPSHTVALELLREFELLGGVGVAAPSANRFGKVSATTAYAVNSELGSFLTVNDQILDGKSCAIGVESTIVDCTNDLPSILRPGAITKNMIDELLNISISSKKSISKNTQIKVPGLLKSHYSPNASIFLKGTPRSGDGYIATSDKPTPIGVIRLASPTNNDEFAQILYTALRQADEKGLEKVFIEPPIGSGIADAINDRLKKASH
jgi:L-threonylcarbamoyladenylate synthase